MSVDRCASTISSPRRARLAHAEAKGREIVRPVDAVVAQKLDASVQSRVVPVNAIGAFDMILDIGPRSVQRVISVLAQAKTLVWNGPFGAFEVKPFDQGKGDGGADRGWQARLGRRRRGHGRGP